jgi:hypothetical protein
MKTALTCLCIVVAALVLGNLQGSRLEKLNQQLTSSETAYRSKGHDRESSDNFPVYRSKYERTSKHAVAKDVYQSMLGYLAGRKSTQTGDMASMTDRNKDAFKAILQLDPLGLKELITMISQSKDPVLKMTGAVKYEQITLCIIALADQDPGYALEYVMNFEKEIGPKVLDHFKTDGWQGYILRRLGDRDPQRAMDGLVRLVEDRANPWSDDSVRSFLAKIARQDPGVVMDTIDRLPEAKGQYFVEALAYQMESNDERAALFLAIRDHFRSRPELMKVGLASLFRRFEDARESPAELRQWADSLEMSDAEKFLIFDSLDNITIREGDGEEYARWFATFMPQSPARKRLVWKALSSWDRMDSEKAMAFIVEQGIDLQEMRRLDEITN